MSHRNNILSQFAIYVIGLGNVLFGSLKNSTSTIMFTKQIFECFVGSLLYGPIFNLTNGHSTLIYRTDSGSII